MHLPESPTWGDLLTWATARLKDAGSPTPRLDASVLLAHQLDVPRTVLVAHPERAAAPDLVKHYQDMIDRRTEGEPVAYLTGHKEFMGLDILVDHRVLVPRPETELVVEAALTALAARLRPPPIDDEPDDDSSSVEATDRPRSAEELVPDLLAADIGTGSGAIAIALAALEPRLGRIYAVDRSPDALEVARHNGDRLLVADRISWLTGDLLAAVPVPVDLIVANLPYVRNAPGEAQPNVIAFEPHQAVFGSDPDGLGEIRRLIAQAPGKLRPAGILVLEHGYDQRAAIAELLAATLPQATIVFGKDYAGWDRFVVAQLP